jgi:heat shock protein HslJ
MAWRQNGMRTVMTLAALVIVAGCGDTVTQTGDNDGLEGHTFLSESVTEAGEPRDLVDGTQIRLEFGDDGNLSVNAGCNHLLATASIGADALEVDGVGGTEMGCDPDRHAQDEWISEFLTGSTGWALDGDRLTLTSGDTEIVLLDRVVADPDRPLEGTRWIVDTIISGSGNDGAASSMYAGTEGSAWLVIEDDRFTAHSGCREYTGSVTESGTQLAFADTVQTDPACAPELEEIDEVMAAIVTGEVEFNIEAARLRLDHPDDVGLALHADE